MGWGGDAHLAGWGGDAHLTCANWGVQLLASKFPSFIENLPSAKKI